MAHSAALENNHLCGISTQLWFHEGRERVPRTTIMASDTYFEYSKHLLAGWLAGRVLVIWGEPNPNQNMCKASLGHSEPGCHPRLRAWRLCSSEQNAELSCLAELGELNQGGREAGW